MQADVGRTEAELRFPYDVYGGAEARQDDGVVELVESSGLCSLSWMLLHWGTSGCIGQSVPIGGQGIKQGLQCDVG